MSAADSPTSDDCIDGVHVTEHQVHLPLSKLSLAVRVWNAPIHSISSQCAHPASSSSPSTPQLVTPLLPPPREQDLSFVLLHGWLDNAASWDPILPRIIHGFEKSNMARLLVSSSPLSSSATSSSSLCASRLVCYCIELSGHGNSSHRSLGGSYHPAEHAFDVLQALDVLGLVRLRQSTSEAAAASVASAPFCPALARPSKLMLAGHSMGGAIAQILASSLGLASSKSSSSASSSQLLGLIMMDSVGPWISPLSATPPYPDVSKFVAHLAEVDAGAALPRSRDRPQQHHLDLFAPSSSAAYNLLQSSPSTPPSSSSSTSGIPLRPPSKLHPSLDSILSKYVRSNPFMDESSAKILAKRATKQVWQHRSTGIRIDTAASASSTPHIGIPQLRELTRYGLRSPTEAPDEWTQGWIFKHDPRLVSSAPLLPLETNTIESFSCIACPMQMFLASNTRRRAVYASKEGRREGAASQWMLAEAHPQFESILTSRLRALKNGVQVVRVEGDHHLHMDAASVEDIANRIVTFMERCYCSSFESTSGMTSARSKL